MPKSVSKKKEDKLTGAKSGRNVSKSRGRKSSKSKSKSRTMRRRSRRRSRNKSGIFGCCAKKRTSRRRSKRRHKSKKTSTKKSTSKKISKPPTAKSSKEASSKKETEEKAAALAKKKSVENQKAVANMKAESSTNLEAAAAPTPAPKPTEAPPSDPMNTPPLLTKENNEANEEKGGEGNEKKTNVKASTCKEEPKVKEHLEEDEANTPRRDVQYPSQKFFMTQFVENNCRVRRWVYEDSTPINMHSNMKHLLKIAKDKIQACRSENDKRELLNKDLNELANILDNV